VWATLAYAAIIGENMESVDTLGPPQLPVTKDNWRLTPLTGRQFSFIYDTLVRERTQKAKLIDEAIRGVPALEGAMPKGIQAHEIPVLTWASPKEMERLIEFAHRMREERNEARLIAGALKGMVMKQGTSKKGVERAIRDILTLSKQINRNLISTPAPVVEGYREAASSLRLSSEVAPLWGCPSSVPEVNSVAAT
jgi:hypothetical protein